MLVGRRSVGEVNCALEPLPLGARLHAAAQRTTQTVPQASAGLDAHGSIEDSRTAIRSHRPLADPAEEVLGECAPVTDLVRVCVLFIGFSIM